MDEMYVLHALHGQPPKEKSKNEPPPATEEPNPNWEMELAQAYVRAQPLTGIFAPEESLIMGTVFPNLSQPYGGKG